MNGSNSKLAKAKNVNEHGRTDKVLWEEGNFVSIVFDAISALVIILDPEGRIVRFNRTCERITGYALEEAKGNCVWDLFLTREDRERARKFFDELQANQFPNERESYLVTKQGERRLIAWSNTAILDEEESIRYVIGTGIDITDRRQLETQFLRAQKMESIGRLAGGVAHDFNNLLTAITGYAALAMGSISSNHSSYPYFQEVQKAANRASSLTHHLLAFARRQSIEPKIINLNDLVMDMNKLLSRLIGEDVELITLTRADLSPVKVDPGQIEQVLVNLVVNARDAMPEGGKLVIETANVVLEEEYTRRHAHVPPGEYVMLAVSDTGVGMSEEVKAHLFEPFFTTKEKEKGTGLGLATCYGIIKQSGGHIWVYSEEGKGTTFKIYLPHIKGAARTLAQREESVPLPRGTETILLVDDEPLVREVVGLMLREQGYRVLEAASGNEAIRLAQKHADEGIDILLTDVIMPQMNGRELANRLMAMNPQMKVVFVSGYTDDTIAHHGVLEAGTHYLQKPLPLATLARKLREVLGQPAESDARGEPHHKSIS